MAGSRVKGENLRFPPVTDTSIGVTEQPASQIEEEDRRSETSEAQSVETGAAQDCHSVVDNKEAFLSRPESG